MMEGGFIMSKLILRTMIMMAFLIPFFSLLGCSGYVWVPERGNYIPVEVLEADNAVKKAKQAGKSIDCPKAFKAAERLIENAYQVFKQCRTYEAIDMAREARDKALALCPASAEPPSPQTPRTPPPLFPRLSTDSKLYERMRLKVNFDFDKAILKEGEKAKLLNAAYFLKRHFYTDIFIEGHTCSIGKHNYNQTLSEKRAQAIKSFLIKEGGIDVSRIVMVGYSELLPDVPNKTKEGKAKNRRSEIVVISK